MCLLSNQIAGFFDHIWKESVEVLRFSVSITLGWVKPGVTLVQSDSRILWSLISLLSLVLSYPPPQLPLCLSCFLGALCDCATFDDIFFVIMGQDFSSLSTLVSEVLSCRVYVLKCQVHWIFYTDDIGFASTLTGHPTHTNVHTQT